MARKYTRDNRGRFASGGSGATARGGRLKTAAGNKRATQTMTAKGAGGPAGTIAKGGNGVRGSVARSLAATRKPAAAPAKPAAPAQAKAAPKAATATKPTVYRTRSQAAAAQLDRKRQVAEIGERLPKVGAAQSLGRRAVKVNQGNLLTGRVDKVTANVVTQKGSTKIGQSSFAKKTQKRMERVESRIDALVSARRSLPQRRRRSADKAAAIKIDRSLSKMSKAADTYRTARPKARRK